MAFIPLILRRATRRISLLLILAFGVILSTALLSSAPVLVDTVIELGLPRRLRAAALNNPLDAHLRVTTFANLGETDYQPINDSVRTPIQTRFGDHIEAISLIVQSHWLFPWIENIPVDNERVNFRYVEGIEDKITFIAGGWPSSSVSGGEREGVISEAMADYYNLTVGSELLLSHDDDSQNPDTAIVISGVIRPINASDPFWMGKYNPLQSQSNKRYFEQFGILLPAETFFPLVAELFPRSRAELAWHILFDPNTITTTRLPALANNLGRLSDDFDATIAFETGLRDLLLDFYFQTQGIRLPLYLLTSEIVLLALAYVVMTASQHVRAIEGEFAILRSRGASAQQIFRIQFVEAAMIAGIALLSGPGLGLQLIKILERIGPLSDVSNTQSLLTASQSAWTAAWVGAGACVASLLLPVFPALRRSIVSHIQSTGRIQKPLWQRLYLDVALLVLGLLLLFRLQLYGGIGAGETTPRVDWLLLLSPLTLLLGAATLIIRLAPPVLGLLSRITSLGRGLPAPLALWQAARNPNQFAGIVLLLTLANALGILTVGLNTTLDASEFERARYAVGGEVRLTTDTMPRAGQLNLLSAANYQPPIVENSSSVVRMDGTVDVKSFRSFPGFDLLAIDPISFSQVTVYRGDFSEDPMGDLLGNLLTREDAVPGLRLPGEPAEIGVWIAAPLDSESPIPTFLDGNSARERIAYFIKILTQSGESYLLSLTDSDPTCMALGAVNPPAECAMRPWVYFSSPLPDFPATDFPLSIHSLWMRNRAKGGGNLVSGVTLQIFVDDLSVKDKSGAITVVEAFEDAVEILQHELRYPQSDLSIFTYTRDRKVQGDASGKFILNYSRILEYQGLIFNIADRDDVPIPALVSPKFLSVTNLAIGDLVNSTLQEQTILFEIKGVVNYFPTLYEEKEAGFLITSRKALLIRLGNETPFVINPNEIWLDTQPGTRMDDIATENASQIWDAETLRQVMKADPLALGLRSVTFLGYALTTLISVIGFAAHFTLSVRQRETSFGILRAMGLSPWQLYGSLALEQTLIILTGLGLGALLGAVLNQIVLPGLPITLANQAPIPPFIPRTDWRPIGQVFSTLAVVFALTFGVATWALWRAKLHQALRIGQE